MIGTAQLPVIKTGHEPGALDAGQGLVCSPVAVEGSSRLRRLWRGRKITPPIEYTAPGLLRRNVDDIESVEREKFAATIVRRLGADDKLAHLLADKLIVALDLRAAPRSDSVLAWIKPAVSPPPQPDGAQSRTSSPGPRRRVRYVRI
jgi:hypothetical protein